MLRLYGKIIMRLCLGNLNSDKKLPYLGEDGLADMISYENHLSLVMD